MKRCLSQKKTYISWYRWQPAKYPSGEVWFGLFNRHEWQSLDSSNKHEGKMKRKEVEESSIQILKDGNENMARSRKCSRIFWPASSSSSSLAATISTGSVTTQPPNPTRKASSSITGYQTTNEQQSERQKE